MCHEEAPKESGRIEIEYNTSTSDLCFMFTSFIATAAK
jgi:hypothetical protein